MQLEGKPTPYLSPNLTVSGTCNENVRMPDITHGLEKSRTGSTVDLSTTSVLPGM